jgi:recombination protein RecT
MYRSGAGAKVVVREVCAADRFAYVEGVDDKPRHEIGGRGTTGADFFGENGSRNRGAMVGVYAYAQLTTGAYSRVVIMDRDDVMAARESSDAKDSKFSPWNRLDGGKDHPELTGRSMWWKTAAKRLEPWVPTSAEYRREQLRASASAAASAAAGGPAPWTPPAAAAPDDTDIHDAEVVEDQAGEQPAAPATEAASAGQMQTIGRHFNRLGIGEPDQRLAAACIIAGRELPAMDGLTADEAKTVFSVLTKCSDAGELRELLATGEKPGTGGSDG